MLPIIIAGTGLVSLAGFIYSKKAICSQCSSKFTSNETCPFCGELVCRDCGEELSAIVHEQETVRTAGRYCKTHRAELAAQVDAAIARVDREVAERAALAKKRAAAELRVDQVELFSKSYQGKSPRPTYGVKLKTVYFPEQEAARRELAIQALLVDLDCRVIQDVDLVKDTDSRGNYTYNVWSATGLI
jgi:hypothetical protein